MDRHCTGVILAGGASTRFGGAPKGLAIVGGRRTIDRVASALREQTDDLVLAANDDEAATWLPGVPRVADIRRGVGPLGGIHAALAHGTGAILAVAWDMPFVAPALLNELRRRGEAGYTAVVPENASGRLEPMCAYYGPSAKSHIERWLDSGQSGASAFLEQCPHVDRVALTDVQRFGEPSRLFFSIDTPAALAEAKALSAHS